MEHRGKILGYNSCYNRRKRTSRAYNSRHKTTHSSDRTATQARCTNKRDKATRGSNRRTTGSDSSSTRHKKTNRAYRHKRKDKTGSDTNANGLNSDSGGYLVILDGKGGVVSRQTNTPLDVRSDSGANQNQSTKSFLVLPSVDQSCWSALWIPRPTWSQHGGEASFITLVVLFQLFEWTNKMVRSVTFFCVLNKHWFLTE